MMRLNNLVSLIFIKLIIFYQRFLSDIFSQGQNHCIYPVTCSQFALNQFKNRPWYKALPTSIWRLLSCNPINSRRLNLSQSQKNS